MEEPKIKAPTIATPQAVTTDLFDGNFHIGAALTFSGDGQDTSLVCDDFSGLANGTASVRLTQPFKLDLSKLAALVSALGGDGTGLREQLNAHKELVAPKDSSDDFTLTIDALFIQPASTANDKAIVFLQISTNLAGLKNQVTFLEKIAPVFEFKAAALRVIQCPANRKDMLLAYLSTLPAPKALTPLATAATN